MASSSEEVVFCWPLAFSQWTLSELRERRLPGLPDQVAAFGCSSVPGRQQAGAVWAGSRPAPLVPGSLSHCLREA